MASWNNVIARLSLRHCQALSVIARSSLFLSLRGAEGDEAISKVWNFEH